MKDIHGLGYILDSVAIVLTATQTEPVFQIIQMIATIVASIVSIAFTSMKLYFWWKGAIQDGKITKEEVDEAKKIVEDAKKDKHLDNK